MLLTAHSGANGTAPNTIEYFDAMKNVNVDVVEIDIRLLRKGFFITHDRVFFPEKKGLLPVSYAFDFIKKYDFLINCDLKKPGYVGYVTAVAEKMGVQDRVIFTGSVCDKEGLSSLRFGDVYVNPDYLPKLIPENVKKIKTLLSDMGPRIKGVNVNYAKTPDAFFHACAEENVPVSVFTVDDEKLIKKYAAFPAVTNITTRLADKALAILGREATK